jgi:hypothetical protein
MRVQYVGNSPSISGRLQSSFENPCDPLSLCGPAASGGDASLYSSASYFRYSSILVDGVSLPTETLSSIYLSIYLSSLIRLRLHLRGV